MTIRAPYYSYKWTQKWLPDIYTWTWQYNPNLIGQDKLPIGEIVTALPQRSPPPIQSWTWSSYPYYPPPAVVAVTLEPRAPHFSPPRPPLPLGLTWTWNQTIYMGVPGLPTGIQPGEPVLDLPPKPLRPIDPTWIWRQ